MPSSGCAWDAYRLVIDCSGGDEARRVGLKVFAAEKSRFGNLLLHGLLKRVGLVINQKRTYRNNREEGLQVRTTNLKKSRRPRLKAEVPTKPNPRWPTDFVVDKLSIDQGVKILNVVDDYFRELVGELIRLFISGHQVGRFLTEVCKA